MTFENIGLIKPLIKAVTDKGYSSPSPIQAQTIPVILQGADIMACAQTGTGKTAGFVLPILQKLQDRPAATKKQALVLVLSPTRELAAQIHQSILSYSKYLKIRSAAIFGGVKIYPQIIKLRAGVEVLIATPGRLLDLYRQNAVRFDEVEVLVLDEADHMLDMGFIHDIKKIISLLPKKCQNLLFSATFSDAIRQLAKGFLNNPVEINASPKNTITSLVKQKFHPVDRSRKAELLSHLIRHEKWRQALVFSRTKHGANKLVDHLNDEKINAVAIHGDKNQMQRMKALKNFKSGTVQILVATDIAARGIDIDRLPQVVNFDLPDAPQDYVHRIGRTGRAGSSGQAISLVSHDELRHLRDIERLIKLKIEREEIEGFVPAKLPPLKRGNAKPGARSGAKPGAKPGVKQDRTRRERWQPNKNKKRTYATNATKK